MNKFPAQNATNMSRFYRKRSILLFAVAIIAVPKLLWSQSEHDSHDPAPEAFAAFAAGWVDYQMGHFAEAMRRFYDAALIDHRFSPGTSGMKACAQALEFPQVVAAIERYEAELAEKNPGLRRFADGIVPGLAFWGIYLDGESFDYPGVGRLEIAVEDQLKSLLGDRYIRIAPLERNAPDRAAIAACEYNILGLLSNDENQVFLDLFFIHQWDVATTERTGLESDPAAGVLFKTKRIPLDSTGFESFISSKEGEKFLTAFLNGEGNELPGDFIPKYGFISPTKINGRDEDPFKLLSALAYTEPRLDQFRAILYLGGMKNGALNRYLHAGVKEWFIDRFPVGSEEGSFVGVAHALRVNSRYSREPRSSDARQDNILLNYPGTLGADIVRLNRIPEKLNQNNFGSIILELREVMMRLCLHPILDDQIRLRVARAPDGRYYEEVRIAPEAYGDDLFSALYGEAGGNAQHQLIPLYRSISLIKGRQGKFGLLFESRYIDYNWENLSIGDKRNEAWNMIQFHGDAMREDIDPARLLAAFEEQPQSTYLFDLVTDVGYQLRRKGEIEDNPLFHKLLVLAFRHFNDELLHPERKRIQLDFHLNGGDHLRHLASLSGFDHTPEGIQARKETTIALVEATRSRQWAELKKDIALVRWRMAKAMDPQDDEDYAMIHRLFLPLIEDYLYISNRSNHSIQFYLDWLLMRDRDDFIIQFLDHYRSHILKRLPTEEPIADYHAITLARAVAVGYMKSGDPQSAIAFLRPFLHWETDMDRGGSSKEQDWLRVSQACAWYAEIAMNRGEFDEAHLALNRAAALSEGRDASRWFLSGTKQLSYWNDGEYPTIQEYIVALMDRLNVLEGK